MHMNEKTHWCRPRVELAFFGLKDYVHPDWATTGYYLRMSKHY